jgi:hypothetical protein
MTDSFTFVCLRGCQSGEVVERAVDVTAGKHRFILEPRAFAGLPQP